MTRHPPVVYVSIGREALVGICDPAYLVLVGSSHVLNNLLGLGLGDATLLRQNLA